MSDAAGIQRRALGDFLSWLGSGSDGATTWEAPGVRAAMVPATPQRSLINSVVFDDAGALAAAYDDLAAAYAAAGIEAWTVWTPEHDADAIRLLTGNGHTFDGEPLAMTVDLDDAQSPGPGDLDWDAECSFAELGRINDRAYGFEEGQGIARALAAPRAVSVRSYRALRDGETASVLATMDHGDDTGIYFVATAPEHMRQGLAGRLMAVALREARDRGMRTSSLQSSAKGKAVYERLGYRPHFRLHLYERRG